MLERRSFLARACAVLAGLFGVGRASGHVTKPERPFWRNTGSPESPTWKRCQLEPLRPGEEFRMGAPDDGLAAEAIWTAASAPYRNANGEWEITARAFRAADIAAACRGGVAPLWAHDPVSP